VIGDNASSELNMQINVISADSLSFYRKVSSELNYDFLKFKIDGVEAGSWSGELDWSRVAYKMTTGSHLLKWVYSKDGTVTGISDAAWIDFVVFPPINQAVNISDNVSGLQYVAVYPNPATDVAYLSYGLIKKSEVGITLVNTLGQTVQTVLSTRNENEGNHQIALKTDHLSPGIYFCKVIVDNNIHINKIIITK
jgi:hypothetical protein